MFDIRIVTYVVNAPYFWFSMGMVSCIAMFVGAIIYDGDLKAATKGIISLALYIAMMYQVNVTRIVDFVGHNGYDYTRFGGILAMAFVTFFWLVGIPIGIWGSKVGHNPPKWLHFLISLGRPKRVI